METVFEGCFWLRSLPLKSFENNPKISETGDESIPISIPQSAFKFHRAVDYDNGKKPRRLPWNYG
jgi:hypothetical protein